MGIQSEHFCSPANGVPLADLNTRNKQYVGDDNGDLYSGRIVFINDDDKFEEGYGEDLADFPLIIHQGTDWAAVGGLSTIHSSLSSNGMEQLVGGQMVGWVLTPGMQFFTTEFDSGDTYTLNDPLQIKGTEDGRLEKASAVTDQYVIAKVVDLTDETPGEVDLHGEDGLVFEVIPFGGSFLQG